jgi:hypothetical protein
VLNIRQGSNFNFIQHNKPRDVIYTVYSSLFTSMFVSQSLESEERHEDLLKYQKVLAAQRAPFFLGILTRKTRRCAPLDLGEKYAI